MAGSAKQKHVETGSIAGAMALLGGKDTFGGTLSTPLDAHTAIKSGIPAFALTSLFHKVALLQRAEAVEKALGMSVRTVQRQKKAMEENPRRKGAAAHRLSPEQGGRAWKFAEILSKATEVFGSQAEAEAFLDRPAMGLNQNRPIDLLSTPAGVEIVETHLERIKYGVYA